jgi:hypothetical protein
MLHAAGSYGDGTKHRPRAFAAMELVALVAATCALFLMTVLIALGSLARVLP